MKSIFFCGRLMLVFGLLWGNVNGQSGAVLTGVIENVTGNGVVEIESAKGYRETVQMKDGVFSCHLPPEDQWMSYFINYDNESTSFSFPVLLNKQSRLHLVVNKASHQYTISGDPHAEEQHRFWNEYITTATAYRALEEEVRHVDTTDVKKVTNLKEQLSSKEQEYNGYPRKWVLDHPKMPFSAMVLRMLIAGNPTSGSQDTTAERYFDALLPEATDNNYEAAILRSNLKMYNDKYSVVPLGSNARDFRIKDTTGKTISLKDITGKYVLIDFWASWCAPCREVAPYISEMYNRYKDKGLNLISISMDVNLQKWKAAVKDDQMTWLQGTDLKGMVGGVGLDYQVSYLPYFLLLDNERKVIWKFMDYPDMAGLNLKLQELFGN